MPSKKKAPANTAGKSSQTPTAGKTLALPDGGALAIFAGSESALIPLADEQSSSPYVQFIHPQSKNYSKILTALGKNVKEGEPVLVGGTDFVHLSPMRFILCPAYFQYYAENDTDGKPMGVVLPGEKAPRGFQETIEAIILVDDENTLKPARCRFKGPKCPAIKSAIRLMEEVKSPEWSKENRDNGVAAGSKLPSWAWVTHEVTMTRRQPKRATNDDGNPTKPYDEATSTGSASKPVVLNNLKNLQANPEFAEVLQACMDDFDKNVEQLKKLVVS